MFFHSFAMQIRLCIILVEIIKRKIDLKGIYTILKECAIQLEKSYNGISQLPDVSSKMV